MSSHAEKLEPVGGTLFTKPFIALAALAVLSLVMIPLRFVIGLGPSTGLTDAYPWGLWKIANVIVLTGVASGGYALALIVYGLNRQRYHSIARLAIATSVVGYTSGVIALGVVDLGRPWNFWRLADVTNWNLSSVLLEVGVCVSAYLAFLWLEFSPAVFEAAQKSGTPAWKRWAAAVSPWVTRLFPWIVALAITLPTMHQSSLGSLFLLAGPRLHPFWQTPLLPLFFLMSAWFLGISAVVIAAMLANIYWQRPVPMDILRRLSKGTSVLVLLFFVLRLADISAREVHGLLFQLDRMSVALYVEMALMLPPALVMLYGAEEQSQGSMFRMAMVTLAGGCFYRFNVCLGGFLPGEGWAYFPSTMEVVMSAGLCALGVVAYLWMVKRLPIIDNAPAPAAPASGH